MGQNNSFSQADYARKPTFSGFLPGIAGVHGIPLWCYYVNRGQGIVSFGAQDKDHPIMEFYPAHTAYQNVGRTGFRTFIRTQSGTYEPFRKAHEKQTFTVAPNTIVVTDHDEANGFETKVRYCLLPNAPIGALLRVVTIQNLTRNTQEIEVLDGMPALVPYGVNDWTLKHMTQTGKAWMKVEAVGNAAFFHVNASMADTSEVEEIHGGNFSFAVDDDGQPLTPICDPRAVFGYDTALDQAVIFRDGGLEKLRRQKQVWQNQFPCSFYALRRTLEPNQKCSLFEMYGYVEERADLVQYCREPIGPQLFADAFREARVLTDTIGKRVETHTANPIFDAYCSYTYLDNCLRGGFPLLLGGKQVFYAFSRKHGDLERDYNYFTVKPEYYSQGNGNFRDINQNRRCDVSLSPFVGRSNIDLFFDLLQLDGYNPLQIEPETFVLAQEEQSALAQDCPVIHGLSGVLSSGFSAGQLWRALERNAASPKERELTFAKIIAAAKKQIHASFGEGYWSDHWSYDLDLIEDYLTVWPDREEKLLCDETLTWYPARAGITERCARYRETPNGLRQYNATYPLENSTAGTVEVDAQGNPLRSCLMEKLVLLCAIKYATLDAYAMGIEMEGGKPGWYDALNGLPGLFGSSMAESCELARLLEYTISALERLPHPFAMHREIRALVDELSKITKQEKEPFAYGEKLEFWNARNDCREAYRRSAYRGFSGETAIMEAQTLLPTLENWLQVVRAGIAQAQGMGEVMPTYFYYDVAYRKADGKPIPVHFMQRQTPDFLEGTVRRLKLNDDTATKEALCRSVRGSALYDRELKMYRVNTSLSDASFELGRAVAFTPGWLENGSIWLHMEYKYLLEMLRAGLYAAFFEDFRNAAIPFLDPERYGRSTLENSSFLVSSLNPDESLHGRGFVARLSGSTVEFLHMWRIMMFGESPFSSSQKGLTLAFRPAIPAYLIGKDKMIAATFLGRTQVEYHFDAIQDYMPGAYSMSEAEMTFHDGAVKRSREILGDDAEAVREGLAAKIVMRLTSKP